ncbi:thioredoxin family protein [Reyranella sp. CPCC 100927]|uniref:DUF899 domain-containing protein n=1 Tax=Reyranella sp. CPCC 100927 TaxID=2599616 RepID=UPI0011B4C669|nr:thioredoxin family protein [Reyranella sp. CPCC 100927]TWT01645.1 DUF899 domain-containing protein [Reyranella sp. CPCC 100927]
MDQPRIVSREEWTRERKAHLAKEKEFTRLRDQLSAQRRELPWVKVDTTYVFDTPKGKQTLADLFDGRSQLIVYHFMLGPDDTEGCPGCSFLVDHVDGANLHLAHHDVTFVAVSRAPLAKLKAYKKRMGWHFPWVSSGNTTFNYDYNVSFTQEDVAKGAATYNYEKLDEAIDDLPGISVFYKDANGDIFHTYSSYARGGDILIGAYNYLDLTPKGRNESSTMDWVRRHDRYDTP